MKFKKALSFALASTLLCGSLSFASGLNDGNFFRAYLFGYPNNEIRPESFITRAEVVAIDARLKEQSQDVEAGKSSNYSDINDGWYKNFVDYSTEKKVVKGYPDGTFRPDENITRAEFAKILASSVSENGDKAVNLTDINDHWAKDYIVKLASNGIIDGYENGTFAPEQEIKRAEAVKMINLLYDRYTKEDSLENIDKKELKEFTDLNSNHWAYYHLLEAANNHIANKNDKGLEIWKTIVSDEKLKKAEEKLIKKSDAIKKLGLDIEPKTIATDSWPTTYNLATAGVEIVAGPKDSHLDNKIDGSYEHLVLDKKIQENIIRNTKPDTIIANMENDIIKKEAEEVNAKSIPYEFNTLDEMYDIIGVIASAFGTRDAYVNNMIKINDRIQKVQNLSDKNGNPNTALLIIGREGKDSDGQIYYSLPNKDSFAAQILNSGKLKNLGDQLALGESDKFGFAKVNLDDVMKSDPDAIIMMMRGKKSLRNEDEKEFKNLLKTKYPNSKAVKSDKIGRIDHHGILPKSTLSVAGLEAISAIANKVDNQVPTELKDGTYYGTGTGYAGGLNTKVIVKDGKISSVEVISNNDTDFKIGKVKEFVPNSIVEKQSLDEKDLLYNGDEVVDSVTGSTTSSRGIIESVSNALSKAK